MSFFFTLLHLKFNCDLRCINAIHKFSGIKLPTVTMTVFLICVDMLECRNGKRTLKELNSKVPILR